MSIDEVIETAETDAPNKNTRVMVNLFELKKLRSQADAMKWFSESEIRAAKYRFAAPPEAKPCAVKEGWCLTHQAAAPDERDLSGSPGFVCIEVANKPAPGEKP